MNAIKRWTNRKPRVLFWHGVDFVTNKTVCPEIFSAHLFKKQIQYLRRYYDIISIQEFDSRLETNSFNGKEVLLTFDDGYANNLHVVAPFMTTMDLPYTVFISTDNITSGDFFPTSVNRIISIVAGLDKLSIPSLERSFSIATNVDRLKVSCFLSKELKTRPMDEVKCIVDDLIANISPRQWDALKEKYSCLRPLTWAEVGQLSKMKNVTIGSHCMWHICCHKNQIDATVKEQITKSKQVIEERLQVPCDFFAYPNGNYTTFSSSCVANTYRLGFSAETKMDVSAECKSSLPRIAAYVDLNLFKVLMSS